MKTVLGTSAPSLPSPAARGRIAIAAVLLLACAAPAAGGDDWRRAHSGGFLRLMEQVRRGEFATARAARPGAATRASPGGDVRVNEPSLDTPERTTQSETTLAAHGETLCGSYVDTGSGGLTGIARSPDRGMTWEDRGSVVFASDPVVAVHAATGRFYLGKIGFAAGLGTTIAVFFSDDDCRSFDNFATASPTASLPQHAQDKPWIAVDNSGGAHDGNVYACWSRFLDEGSVAASGAEIRVSRSIDGGATYIDDQAISPPTDFFPFGCSIEVGPLGAVYVSWVDRNTVNAIRLRRSLDGGATWQPVVQANSNPIRHPGIDRIRTCESGATRPTLNGDIRMLAQTWMAVDNSGGPFTGAIYLVWGSDPEGSVDNSDVWFTRSRDGGQTWAPEIQLGGGTETDQFEPYVEVGRSGAVSVAWYDRRNDPANDELIDVYTAISRDGGESFEPASRVTDVSFPVPPLRDQPSGGGNFDPGRSACYMGEYIAVAADRDSFYYLWGDNRDTLVTPSYPAGRPDPNVYFDRLAAPGVCGDGSLDDDERCDDGNRVGGDGCSASCAPEGDANCDGFVTAADAVALARLIADGERAACGEDDANGDGVADAADLAPLLRGLMQEPGPR